ncbi:MAG: ASKHA domain-containing protein [Deltaproteobacteria bacterium]|nr:ASKHA domain-containing protein [Deltaproteobacteria bacterium]
MTETVKITFYPSRIEGVVPKGTTILEAARMLGIGIEGPCNGSGTCSKDLVQVRRNKTIDTVLACKMIIDDDLEVIVPSHENTALKTVEHFHSLENLPSTTPAPPYQGGEFGIALDIGTTTIVAALVDLNSGESVGTTSTLNPLVFYGHDVMSRIRHSVTEKDGLLKMHRELISAVNLLIDLLTADTEIRPENIRQLVAAGNTTMQHIFLNKEIASIGAYPYKAEVLDAFTTTAGDLAVGIAEGATVTTFPCMSAYVGGDIVSGLIAVNLDKSKLPALFIDIGTNGEMALLSEGRTVATSTAAGPCFEGMTISCGMRAAEGAIERVSFEEELSLGVIGEGPARGICGSGLLDLVAELIRIGLVNSRGRLHGRESNDVPKAYRERIFEKNGKRHFKVTENISISQEDIRQVQLARAAIRSGVEVLMIENGIEADQLNSVIIAGGFGYHLRKESLLTVGLLPAFTGATFSFVGNTSLEGARRLLLDKGLAEKSTSIARNVSVVELANVEGFEAKFVGAMCF